MRNDTSIQTLNRLLQFQVNFIIPQNIITFRTPSPFLFSSEKKFNFMTLIKNNWDAFSIKVQCMYMQFKRLFIDNDDVGCNILRLIITRGKMNEIRWPQAQGSLVKSSPKKSLPIWLLDRNLFSFGFLLRSCYDLCWNYGDYLWFIM